MKIAAVLLVWLCLFRQCFPAISGFIDSGNLTTTDELDTVLEDVPELLHGLVKRQATMQCVRRLTIPIQASNGKCSESSVVLDKKNLDTLLTGFENVYNKWWRQGKNACDVEIIRTASKEFSNVLANFLTVIALGVQCTGDQRFPCGWKFADHENLFYFISGENDAAASNVFHTRERDGDEGVSRFAMATGVTFLWEALEFATGNASKDACAFNGKDVASRYTRALASAIEQPVFEGFQEEMDITCFLGTSFGSSIDLGYSEHSMGENDAGDLCFIFRPCPRAVADRCCKENPRKTCRPPKKLCEACKKKLFSWKRGNEVIFGDDDGHTCSCGTF